jgi:hypothetical protein
MTDQVAGETTTSGEPPEIKDLPEWHYVDNGVKKGPATSKTIEDLLKSKTIATDTQVWRKGMIDWKTIRDSDLADLVAFEPPAVASSLIGNGYVWTLAFLPLVFGFIQAGIDYNNNMAAARSLVLGFPYDPSSATPWKLYFIINTGLLVLDYRRLKKAGYGSVWLALSGILLLPIYLFVRATKLKQKPWYAIAWIVSLIVGIAMDAAQ